MIFGIIFGAWLHDKTGHLGVWTALITMGVLEAISFLFWPDMAHDIGFALGTATRFLLGMEGAA